jgi:wyosine [tRNA(Phe)-imidazoG37] synthetase (radical SAM superfamily)
MTWINDRKGMLMATGSLEDRVAALEAQVARLLAPHSNNDRPKDWRRTIGMFAGDEIMREIDEHARKYREEDRRKSLAELDALPPELECTWLMQLVPLHAHHPRRFEENRFVYPVLSRRSEGVSVGVNLNPDKVCNFDCIYCQVDRTSQSETRFVEIPQLIEELESAVRLVASGELFEHDPFRGTPADFRRLNDIAFSGDGEPTTYRNFDEIIAACAAVKQRLGLYAVKMVLITNASMFHRPAVVRGLAILDQNNGEVWAKLDAGTAEYYQLIERTTIPFRQVLDNIAAAARARPLVIQSLFMRVNNEPPSPAEIMAYCERLSEVVASGGAIKLVQVYTVARRPAETYVTPLTDAEVDTIVDAVRNTTGLSAKAFYGAAA